MIRAHLHYDPDDKDSYARAFRLARLELAEHLAAEEGVPRRRMVAAGGDGGLMELDRVAGMVLGLD